MSADLREDVDAFLSTTKEIGAFPGWFSDPKTGEYRCATPLLVDGEIVGRLEIQAYPNEPQPSYRIVLIFMEKCVCRLDCRDADGPHYNDQNRPAGMVLGPIFGQHVHFWSDNRRFAGYNSLPDRLRNARELQPAIKAYDSSFRWFCSEFSIDIAGLQLPQLPPRDKLL